MNTKKIKISELKNTAHTIFFDGSAKFIIKDDYLIFYSEYDDIKRSIEKVWEPYHEHDCEDCIRLESYYEDNKSYDLYFCIQGELNIPTVIARYGDNENYYSGLIFADTNKHLARAKKLADGLNLL